MNAINIDDLEPELLVRQMEDFKIFSAAFKRSPETFNRSMSRPRPVTIHHRRWRSDSPEAGWSLQKLFDWRALERRAAEMRTELRVRREHFWGTMKRYADSIKKTKTVWVVDPDEPDSVMVYEDSSIMWEKADDLIDRAVPNPNKRALVLKDDDARLMLKLYRREHTYACRAGTFESAFRYAVECRLQVYVSSKLHNRHPRNYHDGGLFIINNEDRRYAVLSDDRGRINWIDATIFDCK